MNVLSQPLDPPSPRAATGPRKKRKTEDKQDSKTLLTCTYRWKLMRVDKKRRPRGAWEDAAAAPPGKMAAAASVVRRVPIVPC